jgi:hypothetical protein
MLLCPTVMAPTCSCSTPEGALCPDHVEPFAATGLSYGSGCRRIATYGGPGKRPGESCTGFRLDPEGRDKPAQGVLACVFCYEPKPVRGAMGARCDGFDYEGKSRSGTLVCGKARERASLSGGSGRL